MDRGHAIIATRASPSPADVAPVPPSWRLLAFAATLAAGIALALVVAHFAWRIAAPAPFHALPAPADDPAAVIVSGRLFGAPAATPSGPAPVVDSLGDIRLLGVIAARNGAGQALFRVPSGPVLVRTGDEVLPGVRVTAVEVDGVTVRDASGEHRLAFSRRSDAAPNAARLAAPPPAPVASRNVPATPTSACQPPQGFRGEVLRLNVELVGGLIAQPEVWRSMVEPAAGALVVKETAGFAQMVGLQQGDRLEQANGIALTVPDDVVGAVLRPLAANQSVHLVGRRNGQRREVWVANINCGR